MSVPSVSIGRSGLSPSAVHSVALLGAPVRVHPDARPAVLASRAAVEALLHPDAPRVYGINTGFGALAEQRIGDADLERLQMNLIRSHACGVGPPYSTDVVRAMVLLRAHVLARGHSGARPEVIDALVGLLNRRVHPRIPSRGSVGASGDLAPLAHLALVLIGEGEAEVEGRVLPGGEALAAAGLEPITLQAKEGLALINGTQAMLAEGTLALLEAERLARVADIACAITVEALLGSHRPFDARFADLRPHPGHRQSAAALRKLLGESEINESHQAHCEKVQDPYSLRCAPQVHGATRDALSHARAVLTAELDAVTDNPLVFPAKDEAAPTEFLSGGNFHGQGVALAMDFMAIAVAELGNISERRVEQLVNPALNVGLPPFLAPNPGLTSGFMIAQVSAASLVSECKVLAHPASVDSIPSSANREDHVSMGTFAAAKARTIVGNVARVLGIELMCGAQAVDLRAPLSPGVGVAAAVRAIRGSVAPLDDDRQLSGDIEALAKMALGDLLAQVEATIGALP
jgi:histidine ammonia-lyase